MSTIKVDTIKDTNNVEVYTCKAWVNFDGTQAAADMIRDSGNVSSITDNGTGRYAINFTNDMEDANYSIIVTNGSDATINSYARYGNSNASQTTPTVSSFEVITGYTSSGRTQQDSAYVFAAVFR